MRKTTLILAFVTLLFPLGLHGEAANAPVKGVGSPTMPTTAKSNITPSVATPPANSGCQEKADSFDCSFVGTRVGSVERISLPGSERRDILVIGIPGQEIKIEANSETLPILESCERIALRAYNTVDNNFYFLINATYPRSANYSQWVGLHQSQVPLAENVKLSCKIYSIYF